MKMKFNDGQMLVGIVIRGASERIEQTLKTIEKDRAIEVVYVRRADPDSFLLIVETKRVKREGNLNFASR